jgi:hypothetical protein
MKKPTADSEKKIGVAVRAAAYTRWVELREKRTPGHEERHEWIRSLLAGENVRSLDSDVIKVDHLARALAPNGVLLWAKEHKYFEALDDLRRNLDEIKKEFPGSERTSD